MTKALRERGGALLALGTARMEYGAGDALRIVLGDLAAAHYTRQVARRPAWIASVARVAEGAACVARVAGVAGIPAWVGVAAGVTGWRSTRAAPADRTALPLEKRVRANRCLAH